MPLSHKHEKTPLVPISRRFPFFFIEHAAITKHEHSIAIWKGNKNEGDSKFVCMPVASLGALLLGPGCSITSEACRVLATRGCLIAVTGGMASPVYLCSNQHRSPHTKIKQMTIVQNPSLRLKAAKSLLESRSKFLKDFCPLLPKLIVDEKESIEQYSGVEAAWAKKAYANCAKRYEVEWEGKKNEPRVSPLHLLNHLSYGIADIILLHRGYDPNLGILHGRTKGGGFTYDLADIVKPLLALELSFQAKVNNWSAQQMKQEFFTRCIEHDILAVLGKALDQIFAKGITLC